MHPISKTKLSGKTRQDKTCGAFIYSPTEHARHVLNMSSAASSAQDVPVNFSGWMSSGGTFSTL